MPAALTIACAQPETVLGAVAATAQHHVDLVVTAGEGGARLIVFPELSLTGYDLEAPTINLDDARLDGIRTACASFGATAIVGAPVAVDDREFIAMIAIDGSATSIVYRKMWPGPAEAARFAPGPLAVAIDIDGWRVALAICRDTGVQAHTAAVAELDPDLYVAGVVDRPGDQSEQRRRACLINAAVGVPVAVASAAGTHRSGFATTAGQSFVTDAAGVVVAEVGTAPGEIAIATIRRHRR